MDPKFVVFVFISTFLVAAIYSTSTPIAFAKWNCNIPVRGDAEICTHRDSTGKIVDVTYCYKDKNGNQCIHVYGSRIGQDASPDLQNELNDNLQGAGNNTKVPNTDILKDNVTLQENNDDGKEPKSPKVPDDLGGLNDNDSG